MSGKSVRPKKFPTFSIDDLLEESGKQSAHKVGDSYTSSLSSELLNSPGGEQAVRQIISFINPKDVRNLSRVDQHLSQACSDEVKHLKKKLRSDFNKFYRKINTSENNLAPTTTLEENADRLIALLKRTHEFYYFYDAFPLNKEIIRMLEEAYGNIYGDLWSESSNMLNKLLQIEHEEHSEQQGNYFDAITLSAQLSIKTEKINSLYELLTKINDYWYEKQKKIKISLTFPLN